MIKTLIYNNSKKKTNLLLHKNRFIVDEKNNGFGITLVDDPRSNSNKMFCNYYI